MSPTSPSIIQLRQRLRSPPLQGWKHDMQQRMHRSIDSQFGNPPKSPFIRPHLNGDSVDKKRPVALFGTPSSNRIWAIFIGICVIFAITRLFTSSSTVKTSFYNQDALHPVNYLNTSQSAAAASPPFPFCPVHGPGDIIGNKYGAHSMAKSRLHLGSGARIQRLLHRVRTLVIAQACIIIG